MYSDKNEAIIKGWQYVEQGRVYFEEVGPGDVIFKGTTHERELIYSWDKNRWECDCLIWGVFGYCAHTIATEKLLPIPEPIVLQ
jgi:hypothetical protein